MKLSVIVPTRNRAYRIVGCLDSIAGALNNAGLPDAEIIVINNGSTDNTAETVMGWASGSAIPVRFLHEETPGVSRARNRGLRFAQGELLAMTDDDCRLHKDHINDLLRHASADTGVVLRGGRIELGDPTDLPLTIQTSPDREKWNKELKSAKRANLCDHIFGCNMTMPRALVDRVGFFDENFGPGTRIPAGEDSDYNYRAYLAGATLEYVPDMTVSHYHGRKSVAAGNKLFRGYMTGSGALYAKYIFKDPNLCRPLYWNFKHAVKEIISRRNTFLPCIEFSHKDKVFWSIVGAARYPFLIQKSKPESFGPPPGGDLPI